MIESAHNPALQACLRKLEGLARANAPQLQAELNPLLGELRQILAQTQAPPDAAAHRQASEPVPMSLYRQIFEQVPMSLILSDAKGYITDVNAYHLEHFNPYGRSKQAYLGQPIGECGTIEFSRLQQACAEALSGHALELKRCECCVACTAPPLYVNARATPLRWRGRVVGAAFIHEDISELVELEKTLHDSEAFYRVLFEHAGDASFIVGRDGRFLDVNRAACERLGYRREQLLEMAPGDIDPNADANHVQERMEQLLAGQHVIFETEHRRRDGGGIPVEVNARLISYQGHQCFLAVCRDITERKRMEAWLLAEQAILLQRVNERTAELQQANRELAQASRLKNEFLANVSHELRTPLNAVLCLSETLQDNTYGNLNPKQLRALTQIEDSGRHLLALINDILDLSKLEAGKLELQLQPVELSELCEISLQRVRPRAQRKNIRLQLRCDPSLGWVQADDRVLQQVLHNLLSNAVKFTPAGGQVSLEGGVTAGTGEFWFSVRDTGIGIQAEQFDLLFRPFVQLDGGLDRAYEGTGLGLALVRRLVELHGGQVEVNSTPGAGSCFRVSLPWVSLERHAAAGEFSLLGSSG